MAKAARERAVNSAGRRVLDAAVAAAAAARELVGVGGGSSTQPPVVGMLGHPNCGKSALVNKFKHQLPLTFKHQLPLHPQARARS